MEPNPTKKIRLSIIVTSEIAERLDRLAAHIVKRSPGMEPRRSYGLRAAVIAGLVAYETSVEALKRPTPKTSKGRTKGGSR